jgi:hypothetical protein
MSGETLLGTDRPLVSETTRKHLPRLPAVRHALAKLEDPFSDPHQSSDRAARLRSRLDWPSRDRPLGSSLAPRPASRCSRSQRVCAPLARSPGARLRLVSPLRRSYRGSAPSVRATGGFRPLAPEWRRRALATDRGSQVPGRVRSVQLTLPVAPPEPGRTPRCVKIHRMPLIIDRTQSPPALDEASFRAWAATHTVFISSEMSDLQGERSARSACET